MVFQLSIIYDIDCSLLRLWFFLLFLVVVLVIEPIKGALHILHSLISQDILILFLHLLQSTTELAASKLFKPRFPHDQSEKNLFVFIGVEYVGKGVMRQDERGDIMI